MYNRVYVLPDMDFLSSRSEYLPHLEERAGPSKTMNALMFKVNIGFLILLFIYFCADQMFWLCVAELGWNALSIQAAPHDPGASLQ